MIIRAPWGHTGGVAHADGAIQPYKCSHSQIQMVTFNAEIFAIMKQRVSPPFAQTCQMAILCFESICFES